MLMCKQAEKGVSLQAKQADWLEDTDEEIDEQELEAHYSFMAQIQEVLPIESGYDAEPLEKIQYDAEYNVFANERQHSEQLNQLMTHMTIRQKDMTYQRYLEIKAYEVFVVKEKHDELVKQSLLTKSSYEGLVKEKNQVIKDLKVKEGNDIDKLIAMIKFLNEIVYKHNQLIQTIHMLAPKGSMYNGRPTFENPMYLKKVQSEKPCLYEIPYDTFDLANRFTPDNEDTLTLDQESRSKMNKDLVKPYDYTKQNNLQYVQSLEKEIDELESDKANFSNIYDLLLQECVSKDVMCSYLHSLSDLDAHT
ncbi:hypothetical protein Tco_1010479, partial [Tanacetum coccineum]